MSDPPPSAEPGFTAPLWTLWMIAVVLALATIFATVSVAMRIELSLAAARFEPVPGKVVASELVQRGGEQLPVALVLVDYEVAGVTHSLRTSGRDGLTRPFAMPHDVVAAYPVGAKVVVFHDPARPARAALVKEIRYGGELGFALGLLGLWIAYVAWIRRKHLDRTRDPTSLDSTARPPRP